jgi:DNA (cytosine-5)-methyltransferase 1
MTGKLKALDLFSGIGGNSLALGDMVETIAYCERDNHAQAVLFSRMLDGLLDAAPVFSDVTALTAADLPDKPDIIIGGFPCQDISVAGKGEGIRESNRSGLFYQIMRLTDEIQPRFLFLENVPAIRTRGLDIVLRELTQRGYDCRWTMLSAAEVGANHKRERWFLLASKRERSASNTNSIRVGHGKQKLEGQPLSSNSEWIGDKRAIANVADSDGAGRQRQRQAQSEKWKDNSKSIGTSEGVANALCNGFPRTEIRRSIKPSNDRDASRPHGGSVTKGRQESSGGGDTLNAEHTDKKTAQPDLGGVVNGLPVAMDKSLPRYLSPDYWQEEPEGIPRVTEEKEQRVERIKRLGNSVVPLQARTAFIKLMNTNN